MAESNTERITLITGAGGSIGRALVARFVEGGDRVLALDRDAGSLHQLVARFGDRVTPVWVELADWPAAYAAVSDAVAQTGPVGALVANAGTAESPSLAGTTPESWRRDVDANLTAGYHAVEAVLPTLRERGGAVVFIGAVNGLTALGHPAYSAAKAGLISLARSLAVEYGPHGVRANVVCGGPVRTPGGGGPQDDRGEARAAMAPWFPLGQAPEPADVAEAAWFLASPAARMISGAVLPVDGGLLAGSPQLASALMQSAD